MSANIPSLADPPRRIPLGARLALLDHRHVTASLYWSLPAAVVLLLAAIARPLPGARTALVVVGAICLLLAMRRAVPRLLRASGTLWRMRFGRATLGRIRSCHLSWQSRFAEKPYAQFVAEWGARDARWAAGRVAGCLIAVAGLFVALPVVTILLIFFGAVVSRALHLPVDVQGDFSLAAFIKLCGMIVLTIVMFIAATGIWRFWFLREFEKEYGEALGPAEPYDDHVRRLLAELAKPQAQPEMTNPFPDESAEVELVCKVEYWAAGKMRLAKARAHFSPRLGFSGIEPLLFEASRPGEIDLIAGLPHDVRLADGQWEAPPWARHAASLALAALVFVVALAALATELFFLLG